MALTESYTVPATHPGTLITDPPVAVSLVFQPVASTITIAPYATKVTMTIGSVVYTLDSADLRELVRLISGT